MKVVKNIGGTVAITDSGDFVESRAESGKSLSTLFVGGAVMPEHKPSFLSKSNILGKKPVGAQPEGIAWVVIPVYHDIVHETASVWYYPTDLYVCPVGDENILKNTDVVLTGQYKQYQVAFQGLKYEDDPYLQQDVDYPLWRYEIKLYPYFTDAGSTSYLNRLIPPNTTTNNFSVGTQTIRPYFIFDAQAHWVDAIEKHVTPLHYAWTENDLISYPEPVSFNIIYPHNECANEWSDIPSYTEDIQIIFSNEMSASGTAGPTDGCASVEVYSEASTDYYIANTVSTKTNTWSATNSIAHTLRIMNYNRTQTYDATYRWVSKMQQHYGHHYDASFSYRCGPWYDANGDKCDRPVEAHSRSFTEDEYLCGGGCYLVSNTEVRPTASHASRANYAIYIINNDFAVYVETWLAGARSQSSWRMQDTGPILTRDVGASEPMCGEFVSLLPCGAQAIPLSSCPGTGTPDNPIYYEGGDNITYDGSIDVYARLNLVDLQSSNILYTSPSYNFGASYITWIEEMLCVLDGSKERMVHGYVQIDTLLLDEIYTSQAKYFVMAFAVRMFSGEMHIIFKMLKASTTGTTGDDGLPVYTSEWEDVTEHYNTIETFITNVYESNNSVMTVISPHGFMTTDSFVTSAAKIKNVVINSLRLPDLSTFK